MIRRLVTIALVLGQLICVAEICRAADGQKQVLVLYALRRDGQLAIMGERDLPRLLGEGLPEGLDYYSEYLDTARFPDVEYQQGFRDFLRVKYQSRRFDVIVAVQDLAVQFLARNRDLFPETAIVYYANDAVASPPNSTGITSSVNLRGSLELALALQPDIANVFVVSGAAVRDRLYDQSAREQFATVGSQLHVEYLTGLAMDELEPRLGHLPPRSIVYYTLLNEDSKGQIFRPLDYLDRITAVANAPTYSWVDSTIGHGVVGGSLRTQSVQVRAIADLTLRVLHGERAADIPVESRDFNMAQVDWRELRRWGIPESRVPAGTHVLFREPSVWERYRAYVVAVAAALFIETALIIGLLVHRRQRQRAEAQLRRSEAELRASHDRIHDLGGKLLQAQEAERSRIARELHDDVSQQLALLEMDLNLLSPSGPSTGGTLVEEALARTQQIARSVRELSHQLHPAKLRLIGLVPAIHGLTEEIARADVAVDFTHSQMPAMLPPDVTLCLFRIAQEALQNALKYSRATRVSIDVHGEGDGVVLAIADDGIGFDVRRAWGKGLGLVSMGERLEAIGGSLDVDAHPGRGTRIRARAPLSPTPGVAAPEWYARRADSA